MAIISALPPTLERHELKYAIPYRYVESISQFIRPYCDLDYHSAIVEDNFYLVNSLYFDTYGMEFLKQRLWGKDGRFNMRVRFYGDTGDPPYFLEIKQKKGVTGLKYRATASKEEWPGILTDPGYRVSKSTPSGERANKELFIRMAMIYAIEPKILTQYRRRAFFSTVDDYARVTMDVSMKYRIQDHYRLTPNDAMLSYDNENIYAKDSDCHNDGTVILELKCNIGQVPMWMLDLISTFELKQQGFSKYMCSSLVSHFDDGTNYMSGDRQAAYYLRE